jgi:DNA polymerase-3 subunit chi
VEAGTPRVTRIAFYVLEAPDPGARLGYACRLIEKIFRLGQKVHACADDSATAQALDELLWTFRQGSFVPHERLAPGTAPEAPVTIGLRDEPAPAADVLVNLSAEAPGDFERFPRVAEIVDGSEESRAAGRARHRFYRSRGIEPETHKVS